MLVTTLAAILIGGAPVAQADCRYDRSAMMALSPDKFDQDMNGGWRTLDKPGCERVVAALLAAYRSKHWGTLSPNELHISYWHEGQLRASAGEVGPAVRLLMAGVDPDSENDFEDYALGTVAFLQGDLAALKAARRRLAAQAKPADWSQTVAAFKAKGFGEPRWPPNLNVLDRLIRCFGKPYDVAYSSSCPPDATVRGVN